MDFKLLSHKKNEEKLIISLFDGLLLTLAFVSISALIMLSLDHFKATYALIFGITTFFIITKFFNLKVHFKIHKSLTSSHIIFVGIIFFVALLLRSEPSLWITGGQDEGVYVNAGKLYAEEGKSHFTDYTRKKFEVYGESEFYDNNNRADIGQSRWPLGRTFFGHSFVTSKGKSEYQPMFMTLQPIWLAMFGSFFGYENEVWALVFLGLISIVAFALLAFEISNASLVVTYLAAIFLSVSPIHAYFSKFPVSEIVTFTFFVSGLYFLARYYNAFQALTNIKSKVNKANLRLQPVSPFFYLIASLFLFFCYFVSRASTFTILPSFVLLSLIAGPMQKKSLLRRDLLFYVFGIFLIYLAAIFFQFQLSYWYSHDMYAYVFGVFGIEKDWKLIAVIFAILLFCTILFYIKKTAGKEIINNWWKKHLPIFASLSLLVSFFGGLWRAYVYAYTEEYVVANPAWFENANQGISSLFQTSFFSFSENLGYIGMLIVFLGVFHFQKSKDPKKIALLCLMAPVFLYAFIFQWSLPYQYYYFRYLFSEAYPLAILLICLYFSDRIEAKNISKKWILFSASFLIVIYSYMSFFQINKREDLNAQVGAKKLISHLNKNDILLFDKVFGAHEALITPFVMFYGLNVNVISNVNQLDTDLKVIRKINFDSIYLLTQNEPKSKDFQMVDEIIFDHSHFEYKHHFPKKFVSEIWALKLYKYNPAFKEI